VILTRVSTSRHGTFGVWTRENVPLCLTLEDPWDNNKRGVSCIPEGVYSFSPHNGVKFKNVWIASNVPGRTGILIHAGNSTADTSGCILVGQNFEGDRLLNSLKTLDKLRQELPKVFKLKIVNAF
jgi:hypothetical protein